MKTGIGVVTVGEVERELVEWLVAHLHEHSGETVSFVAALPLPRWAYDAKRGQFRGEMILRQLRSLPLSELTCVLGLVAADCYAGQLNYVFGLAVLNGHESLVAIPYLCTAVNRQRPTHADIYLRVLKEAMHEIGHNRGLRHCDNPRCVMHFSNTLGDTDRKGYRYCRVCRARLAGLGRDRPVTERKSP